MRTLIRAELVQLRTLRSSYGVLAAMLMLAVGITVADIGNFGPHTPHGYDQLHDALIDAAGSITAVGFALFAATRAGGEYRNKTITQRVLAAPRRWHPVGAKAITYGVLAAATGALAVGVSLVAGAAMAHSKGLTFDPSIGQVAGMFGEVMAASALFAMLGVAVGFLTRSQSAAILTVLGTFIAEQLLAGVIGSAGHYTPYALLNSTLDIGAISPTTAVLTLTGITAALSAASVSLFRRRDVK